uniref:Uncharacterized protein n=1 Tax=Theileria annulata TaxID=5874 RepID=A0A3B0N483_THEAN
MAKLLLYLPLLIIYLAIHNSLSITVLDNKTNFKSYSENFNNKRCKELVNATKSKAKNFSSSIINEFRTHPVSFAVTGASLCISTAFWTKCIDFSEIPLGRPPNNLSESMKNIMNLFLIRRFDGHALLNLLTLYKTMRDMESQLGSTPTMQVFWLSALFAFVSSIFFDYNFDFNFFSRSLISTSCFNNLDEEVLFFGLLETKRKHLLLWLLLSDYLLTFDFREFIGGLSAIVHGGVSLLFYKLLNKV